MTILIRLWFHTPRDPRSKLISNHLFTPVVED
jgi:hypothetical protein